MGFGFGIDGFELGVAEFGFLLGGKNREVDEVDGDHREQGDADDAEEDGRLGLKVADEGAVGELAGFGVGGGGNRIRIGEAGPNENGDHQIENKDRPFDEAADKEDFLLLVHGLKTSYDGIRKNIAHAKEIN